MKIYGKTLALASVILSLPLFVAAQDSPSTSAAGTSQASEMVPVNAALTHDLDAKKDHPGSQFEAKLNQKVRLSDGTELPSGAVLLGKVVEDDMQQQGTSKLALRFDQARLKDGKVIPVRATIVGIFEPASDNSAGYKNQIPNNWTDGTLQVDQLGVIPGVDLHSKIASASSGVFVSTKKDDVRLSRGSQIQLAIAPGSNQANVGGGS
jgi:hypothetical protein